MNSLKPFSQKGDLISCYCVKLRKRRGIGRLIPQRWFIKADRNYLKKIRWCSQPEKNDTIKLGIETQKLDLRPCWTYALNFVRLIPGTIFFVVGGKSPKKWVKF